MDIIETKFDNVIDEINYLKSILKKQALNIAMVANSKLNMHISSINTCTIDNEYKIEPTFETNNARLKLLQSQTYRKLTRFDIVANYLHKTYCFHAEEINLDHVKGSNGLENLIYCAKTYESQFVFEEWISQNYSYFMSLTKPKGLISASQFNITQNFLEQQQQTLNVIQHRQNKILTKYVATLHKNNDVTQWPVIFISEVNILDEKIEQLRAEKIKTKFNNLSEEKTLSLEEYIEIKEKAESDLLNEILILDKKCHWYEVKTTPF